MPFTAYNVQTIIAFTRLQDAVETLESSDLRIIR